MEDNQNERRQKRKVTNIEDDTKIEDNQNGRQPKWKTIEMEDDQIGR